MREHDMNTKGTGARHGAWMAHAADSALKQNALQRMHTPCVSLAAVIAARSEAAAKAAAQGDTPPNPRLHFLPGGMKSVGWISEGTANPRAAGRGRGWGLGAGMGSLGALQ